MKLAYGLSDIVAKWVAERIPHMEGLSFAPYYAVGVLTDDGKAVGGVIFHSDYPQFGTMQMSAASDDPRWLSRSIVKELLAYAFVEKGRQKLWCAIPHSNVRALKVIKGLGFTQEGVLAHHFGDNHAVILRLMRSRYQHLYGDQHGTIR